MIVPGKPELPCAEDRKFREGLDAELSKLILRQGRVYAGFGWPVVTAASYLRFFNYGNGTKNETLQFERRKALNALALAECVEHSGAFTADIINGIWAICEESSWSVAAHLQYGASSVPLPDV